jgi:hypothetical protein
MELNKNCWTLNQFAKDQSKSFQQMRQRTASTLKMTVGSEQGQNRSCQHLQMMTVEYQRSCSEMRIHKYSRSQTDQLEPSMSCLKKTGKGQSRC